LSKLFKKVRMAVGLKKKPKAVEPTFGTTRQLTPEETAAISGVAPERERRRRYGRGAANTPLGNQTDRLGP
jgi:hypothetical protein